MSAGIDLREVEPDPTPALVSGVSAIASAIRAAEAYDAGVDSRRRAT